MCIPDLQRFLIFSILREFGLLAVMGVELVHSLYCWPTPDLDLVSIQMEFQVVGT